MGLAAKIASFDLGGFARMAVLPNPHAPTLSIIAALRAGLPGEEAASPIVPSMVASMLDRGAGELSRIGFAGELENHGISFDVIHSSSSPSLVFLVAQGLAEEAGRMLRLLALVLKQPRFDPEELSKLKEHIRGILKWERSEPARRASAAFSRLIYPEGHPHHRRKIEKRRVDLDALCPEDLRVFHGDVYGSGSLRIAVVGDIEEKSVAEILSFHLEDWKLGRVQNPDWPPVRETPGNERRIEIPDRPNLEVIMGHASSLLRSDEDYIPAQLANACLGQSTLTSRLGLAVRDQAGLTYGINSSFQALIEVPGPWQINMGVSAGNLEAALKLSRETIESFLRDGPTEAELDDERHSWAGSFKVGMATNSAVARLILRQLIANRPMEDLDEMPERILSCSREECLEAMRRHLHPEKISIAVAGSLKN